MGGVDRVCAAVGGCVCACVCVREGGKCVLVISSESVSASLRWFSRAAVRPSVCPEEGRGWGLRWWAWPSHAGGVFGVRWHLGEGLELVRNPGVHLDGLPGE